MELIQSEEVIFPAITICNLNRMKKSLMARNERWKDTAALEDGYKYQMSFPTNPPPSSSPPSTLLNKSRDDEGSSAIRTKRGTGEKPNPADDEYWYYDSRSSQDNEPMAYYDFPTFGVRAPPSGDNLSEVESFKAPRFEKLEPARNPTTRELKDMGHKVEDFIVQCKFNNRICDYSDFTTIQNKHYGNCFTFNHGGENDSAFARVTKAGSSYGLHLTLFIEHHEYVGLLTEESGIRLIAHPRNIYPHPEDVGLSVAPGFSTSIGIRKRHLAEKLRKRWYLLPALENVATARENFVKLKIYFEELNYELVEQIPAHTIESVSGTTGGLLGLYVGFSVITVSEFIVLLYDIIAVALKKS
ncbi:Amiloride-sensitive sodium channel subunit beta-2 [Holothuria leucospilota]|uniref:Amiloride-sensitive sodium channel subunit beta-2 n=1 Tax=Holothuria leucospilota TaxID=206669 RepID=A0A9Q1H5E1_HOLLE|nr:Amiloride-sensitive sodium channel subunit beta-2 [Holothuria leucospilota]